MNAHWQDLYRNNNTDEPERLTAIFKAFQQITEQHGIPVIVPLHPRTSKLLEQNLSTEVYQSITKNPSIKIISPISFLEMTALEQHAKMIVTDSGGVQKEAFFFKKPCVILRAQTEWIELVECGAAKLADAKVDQIIEAFSYFMNQNNLSFPPFFGDGKAAEFICSEMLTVFAGSKELKTAN